MFSLFFCDIFLSSCTFGCWANLVPMPSCPAVLGTNTYRKSHYWIISTTKCFLGSLFNCLPKRPQFHSVNLARKRSFWLHLSLCTDPLLFKTIWDVKIISRVEAHAGFYLALNLALHPKLHEWPQHLSFSCWFSEGVYLRHSFCFSSGEGQSLRGLQSDMYNIHRHIHCICLRLLIHDLDSQTYCSLAPNVSFLLFVCTSNPTNILNGTKVWTDATTDVFIFRRLTKDAWLCNIKIDPSITT